jgi:hypothetical protein
VSALTADTSGSYNLALGYGAGSLLVTGDKNIFIGILVYRRVEICFLTLIFLQPQNYG